MNRNNGPSLPAANGRASRLPKASPRIRAAAAGRTVVDRVRGILLSRSLTLYKVSALTKAMYPRESRYHVPRNFYFQLRSQAWSPTIHQLVSLSRVSGYRLVDWLTVFSFRLSFIPRLQCVLPFPRTTLLDSFLYDERELIPWFQDRLGGSSGPPSVSPLSQLLEPSGQRHLGSLLSADRGAYFYVKIGRQDAFAFPDLVPGSIVRANARLMEKISPTSPGKVSKQIFLIKHSRGVCCCRLYFETGNRVALMATQLPFANVELELGSEARILGVLDMEFRPIVPSKRMALSQSTPSEVAPDLAKLWAPSPLRRRNGAEGPAGPLLRAARFRASLSLRRASEMSRVIANALGDARYFASPGWLSDIEARGGPPRHIHKLLTVCILYPIPFSDLLNSFGLDLSGSSPIPDEWMNGLDHQTLEAEEIAGLEQTSASGFLATILRRIGEVPFFLVRSFPSLCGLSEITLRDVFWVGSQLESLHPSLAGALLVVVDRRKRKPRIFRRKAPWEQPIYLVTRRDGSYVLASCNLENSTIVVHPYAERFVRPERLRDGVDAHVVGQVVTVIRSLPSPP